MSILCSYLDENWNEIHVDAKMNENLPLWKVFHWFSDVERSAGLRDVPSGEEHSHCYRYGGEEIIQIGIFSLSITFGARNYFFLII